MAKEQEVEQKPLEQKEEQTIPYARFKEVLERAKNAEERLTEMETKIQTELKQKEESTLKEKGDYEVLISRVTEERQKERTALEGMIKKSFLTTLGVKHNVIKDDYLNLFNAEFQIDGLEIKNGKDVETAFEKFRTENPTLFKQEEKKSVPKTDNAPFVAPKTVTDHSSHELLLQGAQETVGRWAAKNQK